MYIGKYDKSKTVVLVYIGRYDRQEKNSGTCVCI